MPQNPASAQKPVTIQVTHYYNATPRRVFDAWLDEKTAGKWLFATTTGDIQLVEIDPQLGGLFTIIERRDGVDVGHYGKYIEIGRPKRLVFDFSVDKFSENTTRVTLKFEPQGSGCELTLTHEGVWQYYAKRTTEGWSTILANLASNIK